VKIHPNKNITKKGGQEKAMEAKNDTINKLKSFEALFRNGYKSQVVDQALNKLAFRPEVSCRFSW